MMFIHAFDPTEFLPCNNLAIQPVILSPNCIALADPGIGAQHRRIEDIPIEELSSGGIPSALTPRATAFMLGYMLKAGMAITDGYGSQRGFGNQDHFIRVFESELGMEAARRIHAPQAPSRLSCIWIAEEGAQSRAMLQEMFKAARHVVSVEIAYQIGLSTAAPLRTAVNTSTAPSACSSR